MIPSRWGVKLNPVLILGGLTAVLTAVTTYADIQNMIPETVLNWLRLLTVVLVALGSFVVRSKVTPLADPRTEAGIRLVPAQRRQAAGFIPGPPRTFTTGTATTLVPTPEGRRPKGGGGTTPKGGQDGQG